MSKEAAEWKAKYRLKWPKWNTIAWIWWNAIPYHDFKTWEQFGEDQLKIKWIFCKWDILEMSVAAADKNFATCSKPEWLKLKESRWKHKLKWGHYCLGSIKSKNHLPWLNEKWSKLNESITNGTVSTDYWPIWYWEALEDKPVVKLGWNHFFHEDWLTNKLNK